MSHSPNMLKNENNKLKSTLKSASAVTTCKKSATFDEDNITKTLHPKEKDYGNQSITEPKTPFERTIASDKSKPVDPQKLHARLVDLEKQQQLEQQSSVSFAAKRKQHYDEYKSIEKAKLLFSEEDQNDGTDAAVVAADQQ